MSEKYNTNINSIEEAIKQLEDLKKDRLSFVTGDAEHDNIFLRDVQAIEIVLGNLEALADMQKTADRELENARRINEEHKKENGELREKVKELEEELYSENKIIEEYLDGVPKQKIKDKIEEIEKEENLYAKTNIIKVLQELLQESEDK